MALTEVAQVPSAFEYEIALGEVETEYEDERLVLLDTGAQISIFHNEKLLTNISEVSHQVSITGLSRNSLTIRPTLKGSLPGLDKVVIYISSQTKRNILSFAEVVRNYEVSIAHN